MIAVEPSLTPSFLLVIQYSGSMTWKATEKVSDGYPVKISFLYVPKFLILDVFS